MLVLGYLRSARSLACFQDDLSSLDQPLRARGASYHVLKNVELQGTDLDWGSLRIWHRMLLLRIAFSLILSYPPLLRYFREAVLGTYIPPTKNSNFQRGKTLWDWMQLLFIPVALAVAGFWFNHRERDIEQQRVEADREISYDNQREATLKEYIDKLSELLLHENLGKSEPESEIRKVARVRTLTVLPRLGSRRKRSVLQFLSHIPQFRERKNRIVNRPDQADEGPVDEELAAPAPGYANVNHCGCARDRCPQNSGKSSAL